ncbi:FBD-associated F-box protein At4g10400-like [Lotus japonicus]|uniref:FBD-associated F-box protein At4g10400-like n=1 Tax=Lotus japonicus TaxID=34305 RepID=UPI002582D179|nr:FBD-associated F-box protein At4g10400-like [Lotus japonicus]
MSEEDRISDLPDEILCHILSFLPTKVACTTTVLSKRWISLYYSLTTLHFEDEEEEGGDVPPKKDDEKDIGAHFRFCCFVDKFMLSQQHHPIKTFRLTCRSELWGEDHAPLNVDEWVEVTKRCHVEDFQICFQNLIISPENRCYQDNLLTFDRLYDQPRDQNVDTTIEVLKTSLSKRRRLVENLKLPPSIFTCKSLVVLKLSGLMVGEVGSVELPSLKTLHLVEVFFQERKDFMMLLSGCPVLEDLHASSVNHLQDTLIDGFKDFPNLVTADIRVLHVPFTILYNVQFLRIDRVMVLN